MWNLDKLTVRNALGFCSSVLENGILGTVPASDDYSAFIFYVYWHLILSDNFGTRLEGSWKVKTNTSGPNLISRLLWFFQGFGPNSQFVGLALWIWHCSIHVFSQPSGLHVYCLIKPITHTVHCESYSVSTRPLSVSLWQCYFDSILYKMKIKITFIFYRLPYIYKK